METFEIHITGDENINNVLDQMGIKNIVVELLYPDQALFRTEHMSSVVKLFDSLTDCKFWVSELINKLKKENIQIYRIKIECPFYYQYLSKTLYLESHFKPFNNKYPISRNKKTGKLIATDRTYHKHDFTRFRDEWKNEDVEMCVHDSFIEEDFDWFQLYK